jgi:hypothetical protein
VHAALERLSRADEAFQASSDALAALDSRQAAADARERERWRAWSERPEGPPPASDTTERESIARERALRANDLAAAAIGVKAVEGRKGELRDALKAIDDRLYQMRLDAVFDEARGHGKAMEDAAQVIVVSATKIDALKDGLRSASRAAERANDPGRLSAVYTLLERVEKIQQPSFHGDVSERARMAAEWRERLR